MDTDPRSDQSVDNPLVQSFEQALDGLEAVPLAGSDESVAIGYQDLELEFAWATLQDQLRGADPILWSEAIAELVMEAVARARGSDDPWPELKYRVRPLIVSETGAQQLAKRCADVLAYPYARILLITVVHHVEGGWRYVQQPQLDEWEVGGTAVIAAALENLRRDTPQEAVQTMAEDHYALDTGDGLDASRILILDELTEDARTCGVLAAVPARDVLSFTPFNRRGYQHLRALANLAKRCHDTWPHPICDSLFYVAPGTTLHIGVSRTEDGDPRLTLPEELAAIHAELIDRGLW